MKIVATILTMPIFLSLLGIAPPAPNPQEEAKAVVQDIFAKAGETSIVSDMQKQEEINKKVDFAALARAALGPENKNISQQQFEWFRNTLQEIITRTVYPKSPDFLQGVKITYNSVDLRDSIAEVRSTVQKKADLTDVAYQLHKSGEGWKVVDVTLSGDRWTEVIHDQVVDVLRKKKWKGLKNAMEKRLAELKNTES